VERDAHHDLGVALHLKRDLEGAMAEFREAIRLDAKHAPAHNGLGTTLFEKGDSTGAADEFRTAIAIDPGSARGHYNLGNALRAKGDVGGAIAAYRRAIELDPGNAQPHNNLGSALRAGGDTEGAIAEYRKAIDLDPTHASALYNLSFTFLQQGRFAEAARLYAAAFAADPRPAGDLGQQHRYNAACSAALAADGQGPEAKGSPDKARLVLRQRALAWLRDDLAAYRRLTEGDAQAGGLVRQNLAHWQQDADLASVRDKAALDRLPDNEREQWQQLWQDVAGLLTRVGGKK
jgi:tetratricopeptide (TPR) repeat protein